MNLFRYSAFGLDIESERPLPGWRESQSSSAPTVKVGWCSMPLDSPADSCFSFRISAVAEFRVYRGDRLEIVPLGGSDELVCLHLGKAFAALLCQRNILTLHASAVRTPRGAILFVGDSGAGKSTLAASFVRLGFGLIADEICAINGGSVLPARPYFSLWPDSFRLVKPENPSRPVIRGGEKLLVDVGVGFRVDPEAICAVYILEVGAGPQCSNLGPTVAVASLYRHIYCRRLVEEMGNSARLFKPISDLVRHVQVDSLVRSSGLSAVLDIVHLIRDRMRF